jgi:hypothetical protein
MLHNNVLILLRLILIAVLTLSCDCFAKGGFDVFRPGNVKLDFGTPEADCLGRAVSMPMLVWRIVTPHAHVTQNIHRDFHRLPLTSR